jgi:hypothetical protein
MEYIDTKKRKQDLREFENYHKLIKDLVQREVITKGDDVIYVERQTAIIFELRHLKDIMIFRTRHR